ncbi:MAG: DUF1957 domain-containing protein [Vampirovibrionales bacterium]|nr:DUF1957 domain-containing protein [Vampirovibrionales bacterium]
MGFGSFVLMLHSHLPYYRKAGMWPFGEENLYECMAETYLPLLNMLQDLLEEGVKANITVGITPILAEQLADPHLQEGFVQYLSVRLKAAQEDCARYPNHYTPHSQHLAFLANFYVDWYQQSLDAFEKRYGRDVIGAFRKLQDAGAIDITTSGATHGFTPLLGEKASANAQFKVGSEAYKRLFGRAPRGCWLPECAYMPAQRYLDPVTGEPVVRPSTDAYLYENNLKYFFTEYHAIEGAKTSVERRVFGIYGNIEYIPVSHIKPTGLSTYDAYWMKDYPVAVMGRNDRASFQVWSAAHGYPGDGLYREFHKKDDISGLHYWRLTGKDCDLGNKMLYDPVLAFRQVESQAEHFVNLCYHLLKDNYEATQEQGLLMVSFDTELFGHWWFEGVAWLKAVIRRMNKVEGVAVQSAGDYIETNPPKQAIVLPESTWGQGGHYWVWRNPNTDWMWPIIHDAEARYKGVVDRYRDGANPLETRVLNQAFRELLLLESSDWPFLVTTFQAKDYAEERFQEHVSNFNRLCSMLSEGQVDEAELQRQEEKDNPFADIDYRWYAEPVKSCQITADAISANG